MICTKCKEDKCGEEFYLHVKHGKKQFTKWCKTCFIDSATSRHSELKKVLVEVMGGRCAFCGYSKYFGALEFHHLDAHEKDFGISRGMRSLVRSLSEIKKCVMVCSVCHKEIHAGIINTSGIISQYNEERASAATRALAKKD